VYSTPAGKLQTSVRLSDDWPHGNHIPFVDDYQAPRAIKPLLTGEAAELEALRYLLTPPHPDDIKQFQVEAERAHAFAREQGVLLAGGWGVGVDMANWLCGFENLMILEHDQPALVAELLHILHAWNQQRMAVVLSGNVDLYIYRAWYEGCDFLSPKLFREVILPHLKSDAALAHEHGAQFGYICSSGILPLLDDYREAGIDVLIGVDPIQGTHTDLGQIKKKAAGRLCLWGGVSGAVTVEMDEESEVRDAVRLALAALGPEGFILSPVDNITIDAPKTWSNLQVFIGEWRRNRS
jgi:uroporphyrinogen-III decarboxylase